MRSLPASLALTVVGAFAVGWLLARRPPAPSSGSAPAAAAGRSGAPSGRDGILSDGKPPSGRDPAVTGEAEFPEVFDPQVRAALGNPDLAAAVRAIMARQEEDHCADTRLIQLVEALPESRLAELPALLEAFAKDDYVTRHVLTAWAERRPEAALAWASARGGDTAKLFPSLLTGWTRKDPDAAAAWMEQQPLSGKSRDLQTTLITTLSESDPARALTLLREKGWTINADAVQALLKNQGAADPSAALATLRALVAEFDAGSKDPPDPAEPLSEYAPGKLHPQFNSLLGALLSGASSRSSADFSALLARLSLEEIRDGAESLTMEGFSLHPDAAAALMRNSTGSEKDRMLIRAMTWTDQNLVMGNLDQIRDPALRLDTLREIKWDGSGSEAPVSIDAKPGARAAVLETLDAAPAAQRPELAKTLALSLAPGSPGLAGEIWNTLAPAARADAGILFFKDLAQSSPESAVSLWKADEPGVQTAGLRGLAAGLGASDPARGVELAMAQTDPRLQAEALAGTLAFWSEREPEKAADELERLLPRVDLPMFRTALGTAGVFQSGEISLSSSPGAALRARLETLHPAP